MRIGIRGLIRMGRDGDDGHPLVRVDRALEPAFDFTGDGVLPLTAYIDLPGEEEERLRNRTIRLLLPTRERKRAVDPRRPHRGGQAAACTPLFSTPPRPATRRDDLTLRQRCPPVVPSRLLRAVSSTGMPSIAISASRVPRFHKGKGDPRGSGRSVYARPAATSSSEERRSVGSLPDCGDDRQLSCSERSQNGFAHRVG